MHEPSIRLDTGAFGAARRRRLGKSAAYWLVLLAGAAVVAGALAAVATLFEPQQVTATLAQPAAAKRAAAPAPTVAASEEPAAKAPPPPPAAPGDTPVAVWNGFGGHGAATTLADKARGAGYPVVDVRDAPRRTYRRTYVLYVPGKEREARALVRRLGLRGSVVRPLDIRPAAIKPAHLLVILARP